MAEYLGLTEDQKATWATLREEHKAEMAPLREEGRGLHTSLRSAMDATNPCQRRLALTIGIPAFSADVRPPLADLVFAGQADSSPNDCSA